MRNVFLAVVFGTCLLFGEFWSLVRSGVEAVFNRLVNLYPSLSLLVSCRGCHSFCEGVTSNITINHFTDSDFLFLLTPKSKTLPTVLPNSLPVNIASHILIL